MNTALTNLNRRILVIDDNQAIHDDFRKILGHPDDEDAALQQAEARIFGAEENMLFEIDAASQGEEGVRMMEQAMAEGRPYLMAFVDVRMPPGWDGIETTQRLWKICPDLQVVICTAFADWSWSEMQDSLLSMDRLLILKKPFDTIEILQMASALTQKWLLLQESRLRVGDLEHLVSERTRDLKASQSAALRMMEDAVRHREHAEKACEELKCEMERRAQLEERFREQASLLDKAQEAIMVFDLDGGISYWNKGAEKLYGWHAEEVLGRSVGPLLHKEPDAFRRAFQELMESGEWMGELAQAGKDGTNFSIEAHWTLVRDDDGRRQSILAINTDITIRKQTDGALQMQGRVLESMAEGVVVCDSDGNIVFSNTACNAMFGYESGELFGHHFSVLNGVASEESRRQVEAFWCILEERGTWVGELSSRKKDGMTFMVRARGSTLENTGAKSFVIVVEDITEKKSMEAQFLRSQRMETVGRLASGVAHDMNNILTPITLAAAMLRRPMARDDMEKLLGNIESSAQRGAALIRQLLTLGCEAGGQRQAVPVTDLINDMMQIMHGTFPKNIGLSARLPADLWCAVGDATQLHQVLLNLCVNARDAMPMGGALSIVAENTHFDNDDSMMSLGIKPGPYVMLRVSDTGEGIPSDLKDKIFDPFFTTKETGKGTGLGLSTVMGIVKRHGGCVNFRSLVGTGTTFEVWLPAVPDVTESTDLLAAGPAKAPPHGKGETILVVDDEASIRDVLRKMLIGHGYRVLTAGDGTEAVVLFSEHKDQIKAVLTDIMMPHMDGVTMVRTMRKMAPSTRIVAATGMGSARGRSDKIAVLQSLGVKTLLTKPYTSDEVLTTVGELLAESDEVMAA